MGSGNRWRRLLPLAERTRLPGLVGRFIRDLARSPQQAISALLVFLALAVPAWSIEHARWITPQPSLIAVLALAVLAGLVVARSRLRARAAFLVMALLGVLAAFWQSVGLPESGGDPALVAWWRAVAMTPPNEGTIHFALFLILVAWASGFVSAWFVLRRQNVWVALAVGSLVILVNLSNVPREQYYFLPVFLIAALVLVGQVNIARQGALFQRGGLSFARSGILHLAIALVVVSLVTVGAAWLLPQPKIDQGLVSVTEALRGKDAQSQWFNIFADVHSKWTLLDSRRQDRLSFSDPLSTSRRVQFEVVADRPAYWRIRRYDTYLSWGWTSSEMLEQEVPGQLASVAQDTGDAEIVTYEVENKLRTDVVLTLGEFVSASIPVKLQTFLPAEEDGLSEDSGGTLEGSQEGQEEIDVVAIVSRRMMRPYQRYTVTASVRSPSEEELRAAGEGYPEPIRERYLQLPATLPIRVRLLAGRLTADAETPYDKVLAIQRHVLTLRYNVDADVPPEGVDGVDYFLFESKEGVCTAFASAFAVMLRSVGVPARLNTGYLEGVKDDDTGRYVLRVKDYHSRTEVYFPGYGWVEFSATPVGLDVGGLVAVEDDALGIMEPDFLPGEETPFGLVVDDFPSGGFSAGPGFQGPRVYVYFAVIGIPVALILAIRLAIALALQRLKRANSAAEVYARMCRLASLANLGPVAQETPLEFTARLAAVLPQQTRAIETIAQAYVETQFSPRRELGRLQHGRLQKSWVELAPQLLRRALRFGKRLA